MTPLVAQSTIALITAFAGMLVAAGTLVKLFIDKPATKANAIKLVSEAAGTQLSALQTRVTNAEARVDKVQGELDLCREDRDETRRTNQILIDFIRRRDNWDVSHSHLFPPDDPPPKLNGGLGQYDVTQPNGPTSP